MVITEALIFAKELDNWRQSHGLNVSALARLLGVTKQMMSDVLSNQKSFSSENLLKAKNILSIYNSMDTNQLRENNDPEGLQTVNEAIIKKYCSGKHARLLNFQSGLGLSQNDGFAPVEGTTEPDLATNVAELIKSGRIDEARDLLNQINKSGRIQPATAVQAKPNPYGSTQPPVVVVGGQKGQRAGWAGNQTFSSNGGTLQLTPELVASAKRDVKKLAEQEVVASYCEAGQDSSPKCNFSLFNKTDMDLVHDLHTAGAASADSDMRKATLKAFKVSEERIARLQSGKGNVEDLISKMNSFKT